MKIDFPKHLEWKSCKKDSECKSSNVICKHYKKDDENCVCLSLKWEDAEYGSLKACGTIDMCNESYLLPRENHGRHQPAGTEHPGFATGRGPACQQVGCRVAGGHDTRGGDPRAHGHPRPRGCRNSAR